MGADLTVENARCGEFTELVGDTCRPSLDPTVCDGLTTAAEVDPATGVVTCIGTGGGFACANPVAGKQTLCGQIFDFETNIPFVDLAGATGAECTDATTTGPCSLGITAFDAVALASNPAAATPLAVGEVFIDTSGRFRVSDITVPNGPFIALVFDDAAPANSGPGGSTNRVAIVTTKVADAATADLEGFIAAESTTDRWAATGGPAIANGIYAMVFRGHKTGLDNNDGVTFSRGGGSSTDTDFYFEAGSSKRLDVDPAASSTSENGTALISMASIAEGQAFAGTGSLPSTCVYVARAGATLPDTLFVQLLRPSNAAGMTCPL